jgi:hydroxymethylpyrimidine pyrophosphatase-like HAD family hydrolase
MYKLIVCSVDDTLLTNNHTLSEDTKEALLQAQQAGARLALISRRSPQNLKKIADEYV